MAAAVVGCRSSCSRALPLAVAVAAVLVVVLAHGWCRSRERRRCARRAVVELSEKIKCRCSK